jgi:hypothetical protein
MRVTFLLGHLPTYLLEGAGVSQSEVSVSAGNRNRSSSLQSKDFSSSLCVQTGSEVYPASCPMGTGVPFSGGKERPGRDADHSPKVLRSRMSRRYTSCPPSRLHGMRGTALLFLLLPTYWKYCEDNVK